jgi:hypothetical protein
MTNDPAPPSDGAGISTLRIYTPYFSYSNLRQYKILRDYEEHTVLTGFAALGGFWTFINGLFAIIFGGSLLFFLFGS